MLGRFLYFALLSITLGCSSTVDSQDQESLEEFPKIDRKNYSIEKFENDFQFLIPNDLTESRIESDQALIGFSHLSKEKHVYVERKLISTYMKSLKVRKIDQKDVLSSFADEHSIAFKGILKTSSSSKLIKSEVNKLGCLRTDFEGTSYGYPKTKYYSIRYFLGKEFVYTLVCWTVDKSREEFKNETLAVGLSFKEIK